MATPTYVPLATYTTVATIGNVTFSNISQKFTDLVLVIDASPTGGLAVTVAFNGDNNSNFHQILAYANGSSGAGITAPNQTTFQTNYGFNGDSRYFVKMDVMNYTNSSSNKTVLYRSSLPNMSVAMAGGRWSSNAPVTSIKISSSFLAGSTISLYGIM